MGDMARVAAATAKRLAKNKEVQAAAATAAGWAGTKTGEMVLARRGNRRRAFSLARQVGGRYSEDTIVANRERIVVWKNGRALDCFPPLTSAELDGHKLSEREELQEFNESLLKDPPPLKGQEVKNAAKAAEQGR